jgi:thiosulfate/3-mercaptopyruvate sulfurtransferase
MLTACLLVAFAAEPAYAKPDLLVEAAELIKTPAKFVLLDVRNKPAYDVGHIPGASRVDVDAWSKAMAGKDGEKEWGARLGALGVELDKPVVVYGWGKAVDPGRVWWMLCFWGIRDVRLLNGGYDAYLKAGGKPTKASPAPKATTPMVKRMMERLATKEQLLAELKSGKVGTLIDARMSREFFGTIMSAKRNGAIPEAKNLEWVELINKEGKFKSAAELAKLFKDADIDPTKPTTTYCQSGGRAAVMAFAVELMTGKPARNYYRSWAEWGNDDKTPIVTPKK